MKLRWFLKCTDPVVYLFVGGSLLCLWVDAVAAAVVLMGGAGVLYVMGGGS